MIIKYQKKQQQISTEQTHINKDQQKITKTNKYEQHCQIFVNKKTCNKSTNMNKDRQKNKYKQI